MTIIENIVTLEITPGKWATYPWPLRPGTYEHLSEAERRQIALYLHRVGRRSEHTLRAYAAQLEKFLYWLGAEGYTGLNGAVLMAYQDALRLPSPALRDNGVVTFNPSPPDAVDRAFAPVRAFIGWLHDQQLVPVNYARQVPPLGVANAGALAPRKHFSDRQWSAVLDTLDAMPRHTPGERNRAERLRFILRFAYGMGLRPIELRHHTHAAIKRIDDQWVLDVVGKGLRARRLTFGVIDDFAWEALTRYRQFLKLPAEPAGEPIPLLPILKPVILKIKGPNKGCTFVTRSLAGSSWEEQFKQFLQKEVMAFLYPDDPARQAEAFAADWAHLTPHALRHTRATHLVERYEKSLPFVQRYLGHVDPKTTMQYFHPTI